MCRPRARAGVKEISPTERVADAAPTLRQKTPTQPTRTPEHHMRRALRGPLAAAAGLATSAAAGLASNAAPGPSDRNQALRLATSAVGSRSRCHPFATARRLLQVQVAFRHGARTPMDDPSDEPVSWLTAEQDLSDQPTLRNTRCFDPGSDVGMDPKEVFSKSPGKVFASPGTLEGGGKSGALTREGFQQARGLGAELRARYIDGAAGPLLPARWEAAEPLVVVRSTRMERTVATAAGVLSGLFAADAATMRPRVLFNGKDEWLVAHPASGARPARSSTAATRRRGRTSTRRSAACSSASARRPSRGCCATRARRGPTRSTWAIVAYRDQLACRAAEGKRVPPHVEREAAALDSAATLQMHHMFTGGAAFEADEAAAETEALRLWIGEWGEMVKTAQAAPDDGRRLHPLLGARLDGLAAPALRVPEGRPAAGDVAPFCSNLCVELWASEADDRRVRVLFNGSLVRMACSDADGMQRRRLCGGAQAAHRDRLREGARRERSGEGVRGTAGI